MISRFPNFCPLQLDHRSSVETLIGHLPPYSDFNFTSLWCWNVFGKTRLSQLDGNLVARFSDYITGEEFYSACGNHATSRTLSSLLELSHSDVCNSALKCLPPEFVAGLGDVNLEIREDPDNFDYILSLEAMASYSGNHLRGKRNFVHRFCREHQATIHEFDLTDPTHRRLIEDLLGRWAAQKNLSPQETHNEFAAIGRLFDYYSASSFLTLAVIDREQLIGFSISEVLKDGYAMLHFEKGDLERTGIYPYIMQITARRLWALGCRYLNYQQDLGIPGLRNAKISYSPSFLLKKFQVQRLG